MHVIARVAARMMLPLAMAVEAVVIARLSAIAAMVVALALAQTWRRERVQQSECSQEEAQVAPMRMHVLARVAARMMLPLAMAVEALVLARVSAMELLALAQVAAQAAVMMVALALARMEPM